LFQHPVLANILCWSFSNLAGQQLQCWASTSCVGQHLVGLSATWLASNFNAGLKFQHPVLANILVGLSATWLASNFNAGLLFLAQTGPATEASGYKQIL
jgi:hypothetical protein